MDAQVRRISRTYAPSGKASGQAGKESFGGETLTRNAATLEHQEHPDEENLLPIRAHSSAHVDAGTINHTRMH